MLRCSSARHCFNCSGKTRKPGLSSSRSVFSDGSSDKHVGHVSIEQDEASILRNAMHLPKSSGNFRNPRFLLTFSSWRLERCDKPGGSSVRSSRDRSKGALSWLMYFCNTRFAASSLPDCSSPAAAALRHQLSSEAIHCGGAFPRPIIRRGL